MHGVTNATRCQEIMQHHSISHTYLYDLADQAVLDFLSYNFDSKIYHTKQAPGKGLMVHLDRGRRYVKYRIYHVIYRGQARV